MTLTHAVLSFAVLAGLLTMVPGLDTALVLRAAVTQGRRPAFATALGIGTGALLWGAAAAAGVAALLTASHVAYTVVRVVGAGYLLWLGVRLLVAAGRHSTPLLDDTPTAASLWTCWRRGLLTNLLNPKIGAFYVAVLPQFVPEHSPHLLVGLLLALVHDVEGMVWFTAIILGAGAVRGWLARPSTARTIDGATGAALVGFGVKLSLSGR